MRKYVARFLVGVFICSILSSVMLPPVSSVAQTTPNWLSSTPPTFTKITDITPEGMPSAQSSNRDCQHQEVITRPARLSPLQSKVSHQACVIDTGFGAISSSGYLQRQGSTLSGKVTTSTAQPLVLFPIPRSSTVAILDSSASNGSYVRFIENVDDKLSTDSLYDGRINHILSRPSNEHAVKNIYGELLSVDTDSVSFSADGEWMLASLPGKGFARINTKTYEVLVFTSSINYNNGANPAYKTAISPDGKYAVVSSSSYDKFELYDLSNCIITAVNNVNRGNCSSADLKSVAKQQIPSFRSAVMIRFIGLHALDVYINHTNLSLPITRYTATADGYSYGGFQYIGMGDSFASGEGAYQYKASTDTSVNKCHLSQRSYPYLLASVLNYAQYESVACSGAKQDDITNRNDNYLGQALDKIMAIDRNKIEILNAFDPGKLSQIEFIDKYKPEVTTLSITGNDIGFKDKIIRCLGADTCFDTYEDRLEVAKEIHGQFYQLTNAIKDIKSVGRPDMRIYLIGYPQIGDSEGNCALNVRLNKKELLFAHTLVGYLNEIIKTAAAKSGVFYVDVENAFANHRLCETSSSNVAINGFTAGNDILNIPFIHGPIGNESYHPNALGHELLKSAILAKTNGLSEPMPLPQGNLEFPLIEETLPLLNAPKTNRSTRIIKNLPLIDSGLLKPGQNFSIEIPGLVPIIKPGQLVEAWINSEPVKLGTFEVKSDGSVTVSSKLPESFPAGMHTLHLYATNLSGEELDFYKTIYVPDSTEGSCGVFTDSDIDNDQDGIDDACDPFIDNPPVTIEPETPTEPTAPIEEETIPDSQNPSNPAPETSSPPTQPNNSPSLITGVKELIQTVMLTISLIILRKVF